MEQLARPLRSVLYIPASKARILEKATQLPADALIFDLEDAVTPEAKVEARKALLHALDIHDYDTRYKIIRINGLDTEWGREDAQLVAQSGADVVLLPKVNTPDDLDALVEIVGENVPLWAMMETCQGILNAASIVSHNRLQGCVAGTNDLASELGCACDQNRSALQMGLQTIVMAARSAGLVAIDGVYNKFNDQEGLRLECEQGLALGYDGKSLIHPAQLAITNAIFAPSTNAIELARRQIEAFDEIERTGQGVAVVDGHIVENLHVASARRLIKLAEMINAAAS